MNVNALMDLATGYWRSAALSAAVELELFDRLADGPADAPALAADCQADPAYLRDLLEALVSLGLLERAETGYRIAPDFEPLLSPRGSRCMLGALRYNQGLYPLWGRLTECIRAGRPAVPPGDHLGGDPEATRRFVLGMHSRALGLAPMIVPAIDAEAHRRLLDVGSGPGTFSRRLAEQHPHLQVRQLDLPAVVEVAKELTGQSPAADRITLVAGDYRTDKLPSGDDALLFCGALHQETEAAARDLFARFHQALAPGGTVYVIDLMARADGPTPPMAALFSLNMKLFNPQAGVFRTDRTAELLGEAGFTAVTAVPIADSPYCLVRGRRP